MDTVFIDGFQAQGVKEISDLHSDSPWLDHAVCIEKSNMYGCHWA